MFVKATQPNSERYKRVIRVKVTRGGTWKMHLVRGCTAISANVVGFQNLKLTQQDRNVVWVAESFVTGLRYYGWHAQ